LRILCRSTCGDISESQGRNLTVDEPESLGGTDKGPNPVELEVKVSASDAEAAE
jgi:hypothetical protein